MAHRENIDHGYIRLTLSPSERIALQHIIDKICRDKSLTTLHQYTQAGQFHQLLDEHREDGTKRIAL